MLLVVAAPFLSQNLALSRTDWLISTEVISDGGGITQVCASSDCAQPDRRLRVADCGCHWRVGPPRAPCGAGRGPIMALYHTTTTYAYIVLAAPSLLS